MDTEKRITAIADTIKQLKNQIGCALVVLDGIERELLFINSTDMAKLRGKVRFVGNFWEFFGITLLLSIAAIVTCGIMFPYLTYWSMKYFFTHLEIDFEEIR